MSGYRKAIFAAIVATALTVAMIAGGNVSPEAVTAAWLTVAGVFGITNKADNNSDGSVGGTGS